MNELFEYLLKSNIYFLLLFAIYFLFFRNTTFFNANRIYLLTALLASVFLPLIKPFINLQPSYDPFQNIIYDGISISATSPSVNHSQISVQYIPGYIYVTGLFIFAIRFFLKLHQLMILIKNNTKRDYHGLRLVYSGKNFSPFSFFRFLIIPKEFPHEYQMMLLKHEYIHFSQRHSVDLIMLELFSVIHWYNPLVFLLKKELKAMHEYYADDRMLMENTDRTEYQNGLLGFALGIPVMDFASPFNYSLIKNRMKMMYRRKSNNIARMRYLLSIPVLIFMVTFFGFTTERAVSSDDKIYNEVDVMPEFPGGMQGLRKHIAQNLLYPEEAKNTGISGKIFVNFVVNKNGKVTKAKVLRSDINDPTTGEIVVIGYESGDVSDVSGDIKSLEEESLRVINSLPDFTPGLKDNQKVNVQFTIPITFALTRKEK